MYLLTAALLLLLLDAVIVGMKQLYECECMKSPVVTIVPEEVRARFDLSWFYQRHVDAGGLPIVASVNVPDHALLEAQYIIKSMLAGREDIRRGLIAAGFHCAVMATTEFITDIPEHRDLELLDSRDFWDGRLRGLTRLGSTRRRKSFSCAEENLLHYPGDPYSKESVLVHEFAHAIHEALRQTDPAFDGRLKAIYRSALEKDLWKDTYAASNYYEYWAECVQSYFDANREYSHNHIYFDGNREYSQTLVNTRAEIFEHDPDMARLIDETFKQNPWKYLPPGKRDKPMHLDGYDAATMAGQFEWPTHLEKIPKRREKQADASIERVARDIEGWTVQVDIQLLEGSEDGFGHEAISALAHKLREISMLVPKDRLAALRKIVIFLDREHPKMTYMQYYPSESWLRDHGHDTAMARAVHLPRAGELTRFSMNQQPFAVLHLLALAYHDQVLGVNEPRILAAWKNFKESGRYDQPVLHISGGRRPHEALRDQKEFFAEMTEAFWA